MRAVRIILMTVLTVALMSATAFGAGVAVKHFEKDGTNIAAESSPQPQAIEGDEAVVEPVEDPSTEPADEPDETEAPAPQAVLEPGDKGAKVRDRKSAVKGKRGSVRVDLEGGGNINKK